MAQSEDSSDDDEVRVELSVLKPVDTQQRLDSDPPLLGALEVLGAELAEKSKLSAAMCKGLGPAPQRQYWLTMSSSQARE